MKLPNFAACVLVLGCVASRTTTQSSWSDDAYAGPPLDRLAAIVARFETRTEGLSFEYFALHGVDAVPGHVLPTPEEARTLDAHSARRQAPTDAND